MLTDTQCHNPKSRDNLLEGHGYEVALATQPTYGYL